MQEEQKVLKVMFLYGSDYVIVDIRYRRRVRRKLVHPADLLHSKAAITCQKRELAVISIHRFISHWYKCRWASAKSASCAISAS